VCDNRSWNCGVEGPSDDHGVIALRRQQRRNFLATLLLSDGVPLLLAGDELGRTRRGNNNAYCQDNEISWVDWSLRNGADDLTDVVALRTVDDVVVAGRSLMLLERSPRQP
jgi:isoamylase